MAGKKKQMTAIEQANQRLEHVNRVLKAVRNVNQLIVQSKDRDKLLQGACDCLTETRGCFNAWIALLDDDRKLIASYESGTGENFGSMVTRLEAGDPPVCIQKVLGGEPVVVMEDPPKSCTDCPLASSYSHRGGITAALMHKGHTYGVLVLSVPLEHIQDSEERDLIAELAGDLGYALSNLEQADALAKNKALLDATGRLARVGGWELDAKTRDVSWTDETHRIHEVPLDKKPPLEKAIQFFHPEDRPVLEKALHEALDEGCPYDLELHFTSAKGRELFTRTICTPILENGTVVRLQGTFLDITEQKRIEEALRKSEEQLRITIQSIGDAVISTDINAHVLSMNPVAEALTGWNEQDALGKPLETVFNVISDDPAERAAYQAAFAEGADVVAGQRKYHRPIDFEQAEHAAGIYSRIHAPAAYPAAARQGYIDGYRAAVMGEASPPEK